MLLGHTWLLDARSSYLGPFLRNMQVGSAEKVLGQPIPRFLRMLETFNIKLGRFMILSFKLRFNSLARHNRGWLAAEEV